MVLSLLLHKFKDYILSPFGRARVSACFFNIHVPGPRVSKDSPGRVAQSVGHLTHKSGVLGSIPGLATYFRFSFRFFKKGSCQLLATVCTRSTG